MWSKTRKAMYERLAPSLRGRIQYDIEYCRPHYWTEPPANPKCSCIFCSYHRFFHIVIDKKERIVISSNHVYYKGIAYSEPEEKRECGLFEMKDVGEAMHLYLNVVPIEECLTWENPLLYLFGVLDRRVGKRTVKRLYEEREDKPEWIRKFIELRAQAEQII